MVLCWRLDGAGAFFLALTVVMFVLTAVYTLSYAREDAEKKRFYLFLGLTMGALVGLCLAGNLVTFYMCFELLSLLSFPLVLHTGTAAARRASMTYLGFSVFGASMALFGMLLLGGGATARFTAGGFAMEESGRTRAAYLLLAVGFCCKAGVLPLSNWLPTAHPEAPAPASALLSGVITKAGLLGLLRVTFFAFGADAVRGTFLQTVMVALALSTVFVGSMLAYKEKVLKKRLAFSSVSQLAYGILGLMTLSQAGVCGALLQVLFHSAAKVGLFLCTGTLAHDAGVTRVDAVRSVARRLPVTMGCFAAFSLSLVGIPPFGGFAAKWYLGTGAYAGLPAPYGAVAVIVLLVSALLTAGYLFPIVGDAFFVKPEAFPASGHADAYMLVPLVCLALVVLLVGAMPAGFVRLFTALGAEMLGGAV